VFQFMIMILNKGINSKKENNQILHHTEKKYEFTVLYIHSKLTPDNYNLWTLLQVSAINRYAQRDINTKQYIILIQQF
jgi:hypothetical protein